jgi:hypothetical protein
MDRAGRNFWDTVWKGSVVPAAWNPHKAGITGYWIQRFHNYFKAAFQSIEPLTDRRLIEIGCARSESLPYFAKEYGFSVTGIDYSLKGCELANATLQKEGVTGVVLCRDFFEPSDILREKFDVAVSFGVAEHFDNTARCIKAFSEFLMITVIPNMVGAIGLIQRRLDRTVFNSHVPLDKELLCEAHQAAGLRVMDCDYFLSTNFGVCNLPDLPIRTISWYIKKATLAALRRVSLMVWLFEAHGNRIKGTKFMSPFIICMARKEPGHSPIPS